MSTKAITPATLKAAGYSRININYAQRYVLVGSLEASGLVRHSEGNPYLVPSMWSGGETADNPDIHVAISVASFRSPEMVELAVQGLESYRGMLKGCGDTGGNMAACSVLRKLRRL